jgi:hypothetical protein
LIEIDLREAKGLGNYINTKARGVREEGHPEAKRALRGVQRRSDLVIAP